MTALRRIATALGLAVVLQLGLMTGMPQADDDHRRHHDRWEHRHHGDWEYRSRRYYYREPEVYYYTQPEVYYYHPPPVYVPPPPPPPSVGFDLIFPFHF